MKGLVAFVCSFFTTCIGMYVKISSLISWAAIVSVHSILTFWSPELMSSVLSYLDSLSIGMVWLLGGSIVVSLLVGKNSSVMKSLWWLLFMIILLSFLSLSFLWFYVAFELSLVPMLIMILSQGNQPERLSAGMYLLMYTSIVSIPYLLVVVYLKESVTLWSVYSDVFLMGGTSLLLMAPFFIKMPVFGFHYWLPKAHVEANTSGSMILAGLLLKLGSYGAARVLNILPILKGLGWFSGTFMVLTLLSCVLTILQSDVKKMVAYSSVTHMTFLVVALLSNSKLAFMSILLLSLVHGWASMGLFKSAGLLSHTASSRMGVVISPESSFNWFMIMMGLLLVSNSSIPPMPSFFPELFILSSYLVSSVNMGWVFVLVSLGVCYYNAYLFIWMSHKKPFSSYSGKAELMSGLTIVLTLTLSAVSLGWLTIF